MSLGRQLTLSFAMQARHRGVPTFCLQVVHVEACITNSDVLANKCQSIASSEQAERSVRRQEFRLHTCSGWILQKRIVSCRNGSQQLVHESLLLAVGCKWEVDIE